ncbi:MAG: uridine kinase family protein [Cellulomonas sp.]
MSDVGTSVRAAPARLGAVRLVCVDGPAGSGKTTFAGPLGAELDAQVLHMDDLYEGWSGLADAWRRLAVWVLEPLAQGEPGRYRRYDWAAGEFAEWHDVPVAPVLVVEGCGSAPRAVDGWASLVVWIEAPREVRIARGVARDGAAVLEHWIPWMAQEDAVFAVEGTRDRADVTVDGFGRVVNRRTGASR